MATNKKTINDQTIISKYMDYVLDQDHYPKSVYKFCKDNKIKEEEFYSFFGSLDNVDNAIWSTFFVNAMTAMNNNEEYAGFSNRDKLLTFFYTFFEILTLNRSYVLFALDRYSMPIENLKQLKDLRGHIKDFAGQLIEEGNEDKLFKITKNPVSVYAEGTWLQFLFILKFWKEDSSPGFEKTDIAIEKSVNTIFDLFDSTPINSVLDFGKFLWKEKIKWN